MEANNDTQDTLHTIPLVTDLGDARAITNGDTGPKDEEGINIVWGNAVTESDDPIL